MKYENFSAAKEAFDALNETKYTVTCCFAEDSYIVAKELADLQVGIISRKTDAFDSVVFYVTPDILKVDDEVIESWAENGIFVDVC